MKFDCPHCHVRLSAEPEHYGVTLNCPECASSITVPKPGQMAPPPSQKDVIKFLCPHCQRRLSAVPHQFGKEMPCPHQDCRKPVLVPRPEWKPIPTTLLKKGSADTNDLIQKAQQMTKKPQK